jgi:hypothetical protein
MDCKPCENQINNENEMENNSTNSPSYTKFLFAPIPEHMILEEDDKNLPQQQND